MARFGIFWGMVFILLNLAAFPEVCSAAASGKEAKAVTAPTPSKTKPTADKPAPGMLDPASFTSVKLPPATQEELAALREAAAAYNRRDYAKAAAILTPVAEKGSARAAFSLGLMAMRGHGMPLSTETAEKWWIRSARGGFPDAQYHLGFLHHQSMRGARNPELVARLWTLAAAQGQGDAMYGLGFMYRAGDGIAKDQKKSLKMFTDAAGLGHPGAAYELGLLYKYGRGGVAKDTAKAKQLLQKAAAAGSVQARQELAGMK